MKFNVYSIRDVVAKELGPIFIAKNDDVAVRMVCENFTAPRFKDLELCHIGSFDTEKGLKGSFVSVVHFERSLMNDDFVQEKLFERDDFDHDPAKAEVSK